MIANAIIAIRVVTNKDLEEISLPEGFEFSGFAPLSQTEHEPRFALITECASPQQRVKAFNCIHLDLSRDIVEYLCGMKQPTTCIQARKVS
ncbi:unnamed protein product [Clavelina lepadiformis]|uniref:Uncharacterized protein n=1 Tax=Clavelina lepadiformis TaxID=159417 RepID=A0ABP0F3X3_CLALP